MANREDFRVAWRGKATRAIWQLYNVNQQRVFTNSKHVLSKNPYEAALGVVNSPDFEFHDYHWIKINNVILVYKIDSDYKLVSIETCYSALTGEVAEIFYGVSIDE